MDKSKEINALNSLIATLLDSVEGYRVAAEDIEDEALANRFRSRARERIHSAKLLQSAVVADGGKEEDDTTLLGGIHRAFLKLREVVATKDNVAIIAEVERGEDYLKSKFETAFKDEKLSSPVRAVIQEAWESVKAGHDEMSQLKHRYVQS